MPSIPETLSDDLAASVDRSTQFVVTTSSTRGIEAEVLVAAARQGPMVP